MKGKIRTIAALAGVAALGAAGVAEARTYSVKMHAYDGVQRGIQLSGKYRGVPFGRCTMKGTLVIPNTKQTWTCRGGTVRITARASSGTSNNVRGTWKFTGGTGKFRGIRGGGTFSGKMNTARYTYLGRARY